MVRKTKADTEHTRREIIAAARKVFALRGVSRTTFTQIAEAAGVTRGAIYWHFKDKPALFFAMREQVSLPLIDRMAENIAAEDLQDPLHSIQASMLGMLHMLEEDEATRTTFEIVIFKCEYVDEFASANSPVMHAACNFKQHLTRAYEHAQRQGQLKDGVDAALLALDSYTFMKGLINLWIADCDGTHIRSKARALIAAHIALRNK